MDPALEMASLMDSSEGERELEEDRLELSRPCLK